MSFFFFFFFNSTGLQFGLFLSNFKLKKLYFSTIWQSPLIFFLSKATAPSQLSFSRNSSFSPLFLTQQLPSLASQHQLSLISSQLLTNSIHSSPFHARSFLLTHHLIYFSPIFFFKVNRAIQFHEWWLLGDLMSFIYDFKTYN